jgi:hypothetical protein
VLVESRSSPVQYGLISALSPKSPKSPKGLCRRFAGSQGAPEAQPRIKHPSQRATGSFRSIPASINSPLPGAKDPLATTLAPVLLTVPFPFPSICGRCSCSSWMVLLVVDHSTSTSCIATIERRDLFPVPASRTAIPLEPTIHDRQTRLPSFFSLTYSLSFNNTNGKTQRRQTACFEHCFIHSLIRSNLYFIATTTFLRPDPYRELKLASRTLFQHLRFSPQQLRSLT